MTQPKTNHLPTTSPKDETNGSNVMGIGDGLCIQLALAQPHSSIAYHPVQTSPHATHGGQCGVGGGTSALTAERFCHPDGLQPLACGRFKGALWRPRPHVPPPLRSLAYSDSHPGHVQLHPKLSLTLPPSLSHSLLRPLPPSSAISHPSPFKGSALSPPLNLLPPPNRQHSYHQDEPVHPPDTYCDRPQPSGLPLSPPTALPSTILHLPIDLDTWSLSLTHHLPTGHPFSNFRTLSPVLRMKPLFHRVPPLSACGNLSPSPQCKNMAGIPLHRR